MTVDALDGRESAFSDDTTDVGVSRRRGRELLRQQARRDRSRRSFSATSELSTLAAGGSPPPRVRHDDQHDAQQDHGKPADSQHGVDHRRLARTGAGRRSRSSHPACAPEPELLSDRQRLHALEVVERRVRTPVPDASAGGPLVGPGAALA